MIAYIISFGLILSAPMVNASDTFTNLDTVQQRRWGDNITFQKALHAQRADDFDLAQKLWGELRKPNDSPEILNTLAVQAGAKGENAQALQLLQLASKLSPRYFSIQRNPQQLGGSDVTEGFQPRTETNRLQLIGELPTRGIPVLPNSFIKFTAYEAPSMDLPQAPDVYMAEQLAMNRYFVPPPSAFLREPPDSLAIDNVVEIEKALHDWITNWMNRDIGKYLASYDISFIPPNGLSRIKWELSRHVQIQASQNIKIKISDIQVDVDLNSNTGRTRFVQDYRSDFFQDKVVKILHWTKRGGIWRISAETTQPK